MTLLSAIPSGWAQEVPASSPVVPLIKLEYPGNPPNIRMVYVRLVALGEHAVNQPLLFDTGSVGITVECSVALPARFCSQSGIKITEPLELDGMTVTTQEAVAQYGTYDEYGNIALARVSFGAPGTPVSTAERIPILIRYKQVRRATGEIVGGPLWPKGIFGVSPLGIQAGGALQSPMNAIKVAPGQHRGFYLSPIGSTWKVCTNEQANCPEVAALHIGVDDEIKAGFTLAKLRRLDSEHFFPFVEACVSWESHKVCRPTLYDTGNSTIVIAGPPPGPAMSLPTGIEMTVVGPNAGAWRFTTQYQPEVEFAPTMDINLIGIRYFETNSLLFDLDTREIGFRLGP